MGKLLVDPHLSTIKYLRTADSSICQADGTCFIEMELVNRYVPARASQSQVISAAQAVVDGCIRDHVDPKGGSANHISECTHYVDQNALAYSNVVVRCRQHPVRRRHRDQLELHTVLWQHAATCRDFLQTTVESYGYKLNSETVWVTE